MGKRSILYGVLLNRSEKKQTDYLYEMSCEWVDVYIHKIYKFTQLMHVSLIKGAGRLLI